MQESKLLRLGNTANCSSVAAPATLPIRGTAGSCRPWVRDAQKRPDARPFQTRRSALQPYEI